MACRPWPSRFHTQRLGADIKQTSFAASPQIGKTRFTAWISALSWSALLSPHHSKAADEPAAAAPQRIEVVGTMPLSGTGIALDRVPANVQVLKSADSGLRTGANLADALDRSAGSVHINDTAGNPFQPDVALRGFTVSPALGTPQGLSVFVDGVRVNEAFGDTVDWDLIPSAAISSVTVIPGSQPVFGRNTLGGAISVTTRSGFDSPGAAAHVKLGSFGRRVVGLELGGHHHDFGGLVVAQSFRDRGWGSHNPSRVQHLFSAADWRSGPIQAHLTLTLADTRLEGSQALPQSFLNDPGQAYTWPDFQTNRLAFVSARISSQLSEALRLDGNVYFRRLRSDVRNSNVQNEFDPAQAPGAGNQPTGNSIARIDQSRPGAALQLSSAAPWFGHDNQLTVGVALDGGHTAFTQWQQEAGASRDTTSTAPESLSTSLRSTATAAGLYVSDTLGLGAQTFVTASARHERSDVRLRDQIGTALDGHHTFSRLNPALGITHAVATDMTLYAGYNEGMRTPTPVELTCADPAAPCSLPNAFASDPALRPVVSRTLELGSRGRLGEHLGWNAAVFRTTLSNDIQFISSGGGATSAGYFLNIGRTRRQGLEVGLIGKLGATKLNAHYSLIGARFETPLLLNSPSNSSATSLQCASCTEIRVERGDRIPGVPRQILKLGLEIEPTRSVAMGLGLIAQSSFYARGDENNRDANGPLPGYAVVNLDARWRVATGWELQAQVNNLFDRRYATFGTLGQNVFTGPGNTFDPSGASWRNEQFRTVGAPRGVWLSLNYRWGSDGD